MVWMEVGGRWVRVIPYFYQVLVCWFVNPEQPAVFCYSNLEQF